MGTKLRDLSAEMSLHIQELGFDGAEPYQAWCERAGRSISLKKSARCRADEAVLRRQTRLADALATSRRAERHAGWWLERAAQGSLPADAPPRFHAVAQAGRELAQADWRAYAALLQAWDWPLDDEPAVAELGQNAANTFVAALARLAAGHRDWVRGPESWRCTASNPLSVFTGLARHLFARYPLPAFLATAWFGDRRHQAWYVRLGAGASARDLAGLPTPYTRRMFHCFLGAPEGFTVAGALRRGQVLGLGGDARLVAALLGTRLAQASPHEGFWTTVVQWLVSNPAFPTNQVGPLVDFLHFQRFEGRPIWLDRGRRGHAPPPRPDFSLKGRTPASLLRLIAEWHRELARTRRTVQTSWPACRISGMWLEHAGARWEVEELLSTEALADEGRRMHHCVGSYVDQCANGDAAIFSVREARRRVTVEVRLANKHLVQVRGPYNQEPDPATWEVVEAWARREGLAVPAFLRP